jgi:hypothetical protein
MPLQSGLQIAIAHFSFLHTWYQPVRRCYAPPALSPRTSRGRLEAVLAAAAVIYYAIVSHAGRISLLFSWVRKSGLDAARSKEERWTVD